MATIQYNTKMLNNDESVVDIEYGSIKGTTALLGEDYDYDYDEDSSCCCRCTPKTVFLIIAIISIVFVLMSLAVFGLFMSFGFAMPAFLAFSICSCLIPAIISGFSARFSILLRGKLDKYPSSKIVQYISRRTSLTMSIVWGLSLLVCAPPVFYFMGAGLLSSCYDSCGDSTLPFALGFVHTLAIVTLLVLYAAIVCKLKPIKKKRGIPELSGYSLFRMLMAGNINP